MYIDDLDTRDEWTACPTSVLIQIMLSCKDKHEGSAPRGKMREKYYVSERNRPSKERKESDEQLVAGIKAQVSRESI